MDAPMDRKRADLRSCRRWLQKNFPSAHPVTVRLVDRSKIRLDHEDNVDGDCEFDDDNDRGPRFLIRLADDLSADNLCETLRHEWAHVLREHIPRPEGDEQGFHDELWGLLHSR